MRELSLFSGCGGGLLGTKLLGWTTIGYVEWDPYRCRLLAHRIADGILDDAPVYCGDIRDFISGGYASQYRGVADVVTAGFPCREFSVANYKHLGKGTAGSGEQNQWPATIAVIRLVTPPYIFLENVVGLLGSHNYFAVILRDLAEAGYDARWCCLSGYAVGAPHVRRRIWIAGQRRDRIQGRNAPSPLSSRSQVLADDHEQRRQEHCRQGTIQPQQSAAECGSVRERPWPVDPAMSWSPSEPALGRVADGVARHVDRLAAIGDGQIPRVVAAAWKHLMDNQ